MAAMSIAKTLLCKNRLDSFSAAETQPDSDGAMICKWRADSFAAAQQADGSITSDDTDREMDRRNPHRAPQAGVERRHSAPHNWRREAAYLEALAQQRGDLPALPQRDIPFIDVAGRERRGSMAVQQLNVDSSFNCHEDMSRIEAMEQATREAAIREALEQEMHSACVISAASSSRPHLAPSPARSRGGSQPGQLSGRRSHAPRQGRSSLHAHASTRPGMKQPLVATAIASSNSFGAPSISSPRLQRNASFQGELPRMNSFQGEMPRTNSFQGEMPRTHSFQGDSSFKQAIDAAKAAATETFRAAENFRQAALSPRSRRTSSFGRLETFGRAASPIPRTASFDGGLVVTRMGVSSPCSSRASSFSANGGLSRSNSVQVMPTMPPISGSPGPATPMIYGHPTMSGPQSTSFAPIRAVPDASSIQRVQRAAALEEQAQLTARLNVAAQMIDSLVLDSSVLDEAKRLTEAVAQKQHHRRQQQQRQQQQSRLPSPSPPPQPTYNKARAGRPNGGGVFWKPPPEAARLCARCPSIDALQPSSSFDNPRPPSRTYGYSCAGNSPRLGSFNASPRGRHHV